MERVGGPSFAQWAAECERHAGQQLNGTVRVEGSREAVPGVVIALVSGHDDVVVDAVTDSEGHFRLVVPPGWEDVAKRWRLRLCSPYGRLLFEQAVLIVSRHEEILLLIPELQLESWSPHCPDDEVRAGVSFAGPLVRSRVDGWTRIGVGAHRAGGVIGAPALPVQGLQFVLPWDADEITVSAKPTRFERVELSAPPFPVMPPVPDRGPEVTYADPVPVRAEFYRHDYPAAIARVTHRSRAHGLVFVDVEVIGARHLPERRELEVLRELDVRLKFTRNPERLMKDTDGENNEQIPKGPEQPPSFIYEKIRLPEVRVSKGVELPRRVPQRYPCIIITDNYAFEVTPPGAGSSKPHGAH